VLSQKTEKQTISENYGQLIKKPVNYKKGAKQNFRRKILKIEITLRNNFKNFRDAQPGPGTDLKKLKKKNLSLRQASLSSGAHGSDSLLPYGCDGPA